MRGICVDAAMAKKFINEPLRSWNEWLISYRVVVIRRNSTLSFPKVAPRIFLDLERKNVMEKYSELEPVELNDDELAAVAGGFSVSATNSTITNSLNNSGNITLTNSTLTNSTVG